MIDNIKESLSNIGLTQGEIDVYLALLELGLSTTGRITKGANISSSKVYEVLQRLINKGLVSYVIENGKHHYSATSAERLIDFLEDKKKEISQDQDVIKKIIPKLESKRKQHKEPEAIIYRGKKGALVALDEVIEAGKKGFEVVGYGTEDYPTYFPAQMKEYVKHAKKDKVKSRLIFGKGFKTPNTVAGIRYLPKEFIIPVRTMVYGNKVAFVDFSEPMTTIIIEKKEFAESFMNHFNLLWKIAKK
jgi:HTH-type transcriptional regulator, sugar sensing transcriptional regulator